MEELDPNYYEKVKPEGGFLVAGKNFGMGSSREQAPLVLIHSNTKAVLAKTLRAHLLPQRDQHRPAGRRVRHRPHRRR